MAANLKQQLSEQFSAALDKLTVTSDNIEAATVASAIQNSDPSFVIVDVRGEEDFAAGAKIATAVNIPHDALLADAGKLKSAVDTAVAATKGANAVTLVLVSAESPDLDEAAAGLWSDAIASEADKYSAVNVRLLLGGLSNWIAENGDNAALTVKA
eukprot:GILI01039612.1.p1 GENE.GILI01039612.1~~GILI01039612.1.p1  ORF type:complete len:172 (+),score=49.96 GILI01039612.1:49-516(+)